MTVQPTRNIGIDIDKIISKEPLNPFRYDLLPKPIQQIIETTHEQLSYPKDFIASSMLYAVSVAIGNTRRLEIRPTHTESALLWLALVGRPGTVKSHPLEFALAPIQDRDRTLKQLYDQQKAQYEEEKSLSKKDREAMGLHEDPKKPEFSTWLVSDVTPEALATTHEKNMRGIGLYVDEFKAWYQNFNRYNSGSEEESWLTIWSSKPLRVLRKTSDPLLIERPYIPVGGTIQPGVLLSLLSNRIENGFIDRILFAFPDDVSKIAWLDQPKGSRYEVQEAQSQWYKILNRILDINQEYKDGSVDPLLMHFDEPAKEAFWNWQKLLTDESNRSESEAEQSLLSKMEVYAARLALCIEVLQWACSERGGHREEVRELKHNTVNLSAVKAAIELVEYFTYCARKIRRMAFDSDPLDSLPQDKQTLYANLPEDGSFTTNEAVEKGQLLGMADRTIKRFLKDQKYFNRVSHGQYEKI